jgi:hypothetical protein
VRKKLAGILGRLKPLISKHIVAWLLIVGFCIATAIIILDPTLSTAVIVGLVLFFIAVGFGLSAALNSKPLFAIGCVAFTAAIGVIILNSALVRESVVGFLASLIALLTIDVVRNLKLTKSSFSWDYMPRLFAVALCVALIAVVLDSTLTAAVIVGLSIFTMALFTINALIGSKLLKIFTAIGIVAFSVTELSVALAMISGSSESVVLSLSCGFFLFILGLFGLWSAVNSKTFGLVKAAFNVLKTDKRLLFFPMISGTALIIVFLVTFVAVQTYSTVISVNRWESYALIIGLILFYFISTFVIFFFNAGLIASVSIRLAGGPSTIRKGLYCATRHVKQIAAWALLSATYLAIVQIITSIVARATGPSGDSAKAVQLVMVSGWIAMTIFVTPLIIVEEMGVWDAMNESDNLFRRTWGESVFGSFSFSGTFVSIFFMGFGVILALAYGYYSPLTQELVFYIALAVFIIPLIILYTVLRAIFTMALYTYAKSGKLPSGFTSEYFEGVFTLGV